jgi:hypothetical protein
MEGNTVSVDRVIRAPASAIFAIVADASRHPEIDGSGSVVKLKGGAPDHLTLGSTFGMSMKMGVPYSMSNTVIEYEPDKVIAWQTSLAGPLGRFVGGRIWRYELEEEDGGTKVTETWDISKDKQAFFMRLGKLHQQTATAMSKTLDRLAELTESTAGS